MKKMPLIAALTVILALIHGYAAAAPTLSVNPKLRIMPAVNGVAQEIEIELSMPGIGGGDARELIVTAESGFGVLLTENSSSSSVTVGYRAGVPTSVAYRWTGPLPVKFPVEEIISVSAPSLGVSSRGSFDVGINLDITGVSVTDRIEVGTSAPIEIEIADSFHPDADISSILSDLGITPEIMLDLSAETEDGGIQNVTDSPIVVKFFEGSRRESDVTYPGPGFAKGHLSRTGEGRVIWTGAGGIQPWVSPALPGRYSVIATLKSNTGGVWLKERASSSFDAVGGQNFPEDTSGVVASTIRILRALGYRYRGAGNDSDTAGAMSSLGASMRQFAAPTPVATLGRYVQALMTRGGSINDLAGFVSPFLRGFEGHGVLIATRSGIKSWEALASNGTPYKSAPQGRVYEDERYIVIPFELGGNFTLNLIGSGSGRVSLWKIVPDGVNFKEYEAGDWEREITVNGRVLSPSLGR
ncbi:MAG: hypothetical protein LBI74_05215 [Synergistaceae bacterium]|nr:hypothetical protein [Synergistaceae bacterium]